MKAFAMSSRNIKTASKTILQGPILTFISTFIEKRQFLVASKSFRDILF